MKTTSLVLAPLLLLTACGDDSATGSGGGGGATSSATGTGTQSTSGTQSTTGAGGAGSTTGSSTASSSPASSSSTATGTSTGAGGGAPGESGVGDWEDRPGACPDGSTRIDVTSAAELAQAARGEGAFAGGPGTCYFIHDGVYTSDDNVLLYILDRAATVDDPITFVGESRAGVVIHQRATIENSSGIVLDDLTFDLTGYVHDGAFNTLSLEAGATGIRVRYVTFTGDCATGSQGGHIETSDPSVDDVRVEQAIIEKFGDCSGAGDAGHLDHGVYIATGTNITLHNNVIQGNASRGVQIYTADGDYGTVTGVEISNNLIRGNGHDAYEDGIVVNGAGTGPVRDVSIRHNVLADNFYSGIRFGTASPADIAGVTIERNTFVGNGAESGAEGAGDIAEDVDSAVENVAATVGLNIFVPALRVLNACMPNVAFADNVVSGELGDAGCQSDVVAIDPALEDPAAGLYAPQNPEAQAYGAYSAD